MIVLMIRHGEKPPPAGGAPFGVDEDGRPDPKALSPRGWQRAGALVRFFAPDEGQPARVERPRQLFAAAPVIDEGSRRPLQTIQPLARALALPIETRFGRDDVEGAARAVLACEGPVLVSWEHKRLRALAGALTGDDHVAPHWDDDTYDLVWRLARRQDGTWRFATMPQRLLDGDRA